MDIESAHRLSTGHRNLVVMSDTCGCFFCLATFKPSAIHNWIDKKGTACCPKCGIDSVLPSAGVAITKEFLKAMHDYWFSVV